MVSSSGLSVVSFRPALRCVAAAVLASGWLSLAQAQSLVQLTEQARDSDDVKAMLDFIEHAERPLLR